MKFLPGGRPASAAVIGMGYVGSTVAAVLAAAGVDVAGVDVDRGVVDRLAARRCPYREPGLPELLADGLDAGRLRVTTDYAPAASADVVIIAVGTPVQGTEFVDAHLRDACAELAARLRPGHLVILKSTVPPGVTRKVVAPLLEKSGLKAGEDFGLAFCPERLSEGRALHELRTFPIAVSGWCRDSGRAAAAFWRRTIGADVVGCASMECAEMVKLATNWWIDHNIAMANELARLCGALDVDVLEVIAAANTIRKGAGNVNILLPSVGVGGSCLTKDPWMLWRAARDLGVDLGTVPAARRINDSMPGHTVDLIVRELARMGRGLDGARIAVLGVAFKNNSGDLRATPVAPVVAALRQGGADVSLFDPLADPGEVRERFGLAPAASPREALAGADCVAVLARHDEIDEIDLVALRDTMAGSCVIIDGRAHYSRAAIERFRSHGFAFRGIGR
ncbi:nucleotide sugar dehydrogenase [Actinomadura fibrosa]|uniref:Nucleotide sugar dehydrogenase n=1 Tax=Actinomadura fibrosa TaxID=111802 RepID=A0ABW2Y2D6_9ACTN|nr:nucleotide sugar dehydrogenase [Actinomadura fibrosa]